MADLSVGFEGLIGCPQKSREFSAILAADDSVLFPSEYYCRYSNARDNIRLPVFHENFDIAQVSEGYFFVRQRIGTARSNPLRIARTFFEPLANQADGRMPAREKKIRQQWQVAEPENLGGVHVQRGGEKNQAVDRAAVLHVIQCQSSTHAFTQQVEPGRRVLLLQEADHRRGIFRGLGGCAEISTPATGEAVAASIESVNINSARVQGVGNYSVGAAVISDAMEHQNNAIARSFRRPETVEDAGLIGRDNRAVAIGNGPGDAKSVCRRVDCRRHLL